MGGNNGVIRIGRKGVRRFAFGEDGAPFEVDVVVAFQRWLEVDDSFRPEDPDAPDRSIPLARMAEYHATAVAFVCQLSGYKTPADFDRSMPKSVVEANSISVAEALDFIARLREEYDALADFFVPKRRGERGSPGISAGGLRFSEEGVPAPD